MKQFFKTIAIVVAIAIFSANNFSASAEYQFVDAETLTIINKAQKNEPVWQRIDETKYTMPDGVRRLMRYSTGIVVAFTTDSKNIHLRWNTTVKRCVASNMSPIFHSGLDLYIHDGEAWRYAGSARPKLGKLEHSYPIVRFMEEGKKKCLLYLPAFTTVTSLQIGVDEGATIKALPSPFKKKVVFIGSSLTHGASASRPGVTYVAKVGRALNVETPNLGMSGSCRLDDFYADIVCDTKADAFVFDAFSNSTDQQIKERLYNFVKRITKAHPKTPMIFLQTEVRDGGYFDTRARKRNVDQRNIAESMMTEICKEFKHVYFVNPGITAGEDGEGSIDGTHLNDLGVQRTVDVLVPSLQKILKKYGIR